MKAEGFKGGVNISKSRPCVRIQFVQLQFPLFLFSHIHLSLPQK